MALRFDAILLRPLQQIAHLRQTIRLRQCGEFARNSVPLLLQFRLLRLQPLHALLIPGRLLAEQLHGLPLGEAGRHAVQVVSCPARLDCRDVMRDPLLQFGERLRERVLLDQCLADAGDLIGQRPNLVGIRQQLGSLQRGIGQRGGDPLLLSFEVRPSLGPLLSQRLEFLQD